MLGRNSPKFKPYPKDPSIGSVASEEYANREAEMNRWNNVARMIYAAYIK